MITTLPIRLWIVSQLVGSNHIETHSTFTLLHSRPERPGLELFMRYPNCNRGRTERHNVSVLQYSDPMVRLTGLEPVRLASRDFLTTIVFTTRHFDICLWSGLYLNHCLRFRFLPSSLYTFLFLGLARY